jgi:hypothetical protein
MSGYLIDYYVHRKAVAPETTFEQDDKLKELIVCFAVHLAGRPPGEEHAWTVHLVAAEPYSLFVTGHTDPLDKVGEGTGKIVGNVLTENIRHTDVNSLHAQFTVSNGKVFKSYISSESPVISDMTETFYKQSEQNPLRVSYSRTSDISFGLVALPGWDKSWFHSVDLEKLTESEVSTARQMRKCQYDFICDCSPDKLIPFFNSLSEEAIDELYGDDPELVITCPRCGQFFSVSKAVLNSNKI